MEDKKYITIDDFKKLEIKIGHILSAEKIEGADKLLRLSVDMGEDKPRQIVSGISEYYPDPTVLVGIKCAFAANLEPRVIRGHESQGMILAVNGIKPAPLEAHNSETDTEKTPEKFFSLLQTLPDVIPGSSVK